MADGMVEIRVYGASDDLVEVVGPCWEYNSEGDYVVQADRGEYDAINDGLNGPPRIFRLVNAARETIAWVYAIYGGGWAFALSGVWDHETDSAPLPEGLTATIRQSDEVAYSAELVITAPAGTRFDVVPQRPTRS